MRKPQTIHSDGKINSDPLPWWLSAIVICGAALMAAGAVIAMVRPAMLAPPGAEINEAVHIYAGYLVSRNLAIALMLLLTLFSGARLALGHYLILTAFIQYLDAAIDAGEGRWILVPSVLIVGTAFLTAAYVIFPRPLWKHVFRRHDS